MRRRVSAVLLLGIMLLMAAQPVQAITVKPYAASSADGGLVHVSGTTYILWGSGTGIAEYKYVTATLNVYSNGKWTYVTSTTGSGSTQTVTASANVSLGTGSYQVVATSTTSTGTSTDYSYWYI